MFFRGWSFVILTGCSLFVPKEVSAVTQFSHEASRIGGPDFVTSLQRRSGRSRGDGLAELSSDLRLSIAQVELLVRDRVAVKHSNETLKAPKTCLKDLGAEFVGAVGVGTIHIPKGCHDVSNLVRSDRSSRSCQVSSQESLNVVFDTGSTNLWMASTLCTIGPCIHKGRRRFDPNSSETFIQTSTELDVSFGTAHLGGPVGVDTFRIGPFTVEKQAFGLIRDELGSTFAQLTLEGIVGLAFPSMSATHTPFFDNVIAQKRLRNNMFAFYLTVGEAGGTNGALLWGGVDGRLYDGDMRWVFVTQAHYWSLNLHDFLIGEESLMRLYTSARFGEASGDDSAGFSEKLNVTPKLIVDSGTSFYTAPDNLFDALENKLPLADCDKTLTYPNITYRMHDTGGNTLDLVIPPRDYMVNTGAHCELGFMRMGLPPEFGSALIVGELFMYRFFTVFDRGDGKDTSARVGFALSKRDHSLSASLVGGQSVDIHPHSSNTVVASVGPDGNVAIFASKAGSDHIAL